MPSLDIGIACDLRDDFVGTADAPGDALEEYDSRATLDALAEALAALGHRPRLLGGGRRLLAALLERPPQLVFNIAEGRGGRSREAQTPAVCEMLALPCTHSDALAMGLALDKAMTKRVLAACGIASAAFAVVASLDEARRIDLPFPLFVKPVGEGSSMGVRGSSRVGDTPALLREVERCLHDYRQPALVERYLPGAELTVGIVGTDAGARVLGAMEIAPASGERGDFIYGLEAKRNYLDAVRYHLPPASPGADLCARAEAVALAAHRALGLRDVSRIDLRFDEAGRANVMDINPVPGLNPVSSDLVIMNKLRGGSHRDLVAAILGAAIERHRAANPDFPAGG